MDGKRGFILPLAGIVTQGDGLLFKCQHMDTIRCHTNLKVKLNSVKTTALEEKTLLICCNLFSISDGNPLDLEMSGMSVCVYFLVFFL